MFFLYFALWVIFNGSITLEICIFGIIIAAALFAFTCKFMDYSLKKELGFWKKSGLFFKYVVLLIREIIKANLATVRLILTQKEEIQPALVSFKSDLENPVTKTLLANAITLTPGTITVNLEGDTYYVHCLDKELAEGINESTFTRLTKEMEAKEVNP